MKSVNDVIPPKSLDVERLASAFYREVAGNVTAQELHAIRRRNALHDLAGRDCCASHEFYDANEFMLSAYRECFGCDPAFLADGMDSDTGEAARKVWNGARNKARAEALTDPDARKAELGAAYVAAIGYDPFEDDATTSAAEVAKILSEHAEIALTAEYDAWLEAESLPSACAVETLHECFAMDGDQSARIAWLSAFIIRWEAFEDMSRKA